MKVKTKVIINILIIVLFILYDLIIANQVMSLLGLGMKEYNINTIITDMFWVFIQNIIVSTIVGVVIYGILFFIISKLVKITPEDIKAIIKVFLIVTIILECFFLYLRIDEVMVRISYLDTAKESYVSQYNNGISNITDDNYTEGEYLEETTKKEENEETLINIDEVEREYEIQVKSSKFSIITSIFVEIIRVIVVIVSIIVFSKYAMKINKN